MPPTLIFLDWIMCGLLPIFHSCYMSYPSQWLMDPRWTVIWRWTIQPALILKSHHTTDMMLYPHLISGQSCRHASSSGFPRLDLVCPSSISSFVLHAPHSNITNGSSLNSYMMVDDSTSSDSPEPSPMDLLEVPWVWVPTESNILIPTLDLEWESTQPHAVNWVAAHT